MMKATMAKTEMAVSKISTRKTASGMRLLAGCVLRMRLRTEDRTTGLRSLAAWARGGIAVTGFGVGSGVCSVGPGDLLGFSLSGIIYSCSGISFERIANSRSLQAGVGAPELHPA